MTAAERASSEEPTSALRIEAGWKMHLLARRDGVREWHHADAWCWCGNVPGEPFYPKKDGAAGANLALCWGPLPQVGKVSQ